MKVPIKARPYIRKRKIGQLVHAYEHVASYAQHVWHIYDVLVLDKRSPLLIPVLSSSVDSDEMCIPLVPSSSLDSDTRFPGASTDLEASERSGLPRSLAVHERDDSAGALSPQ